MKSTTRKGSQTMTNPQPPATPMPDTSPPEAPPEAPSQEEGEKYDGGAIPGGPEPEVPEAS
jgi:hypothetical protein